MLEAGRGRQQRRRSCTCPARDGSVSLQALFSRNTVQADLGLRCTLRAKNLTLPNHAANLCGTIASFETYRGYPAGLGRAIIPGDLRILRTLHGDLTRAGSWNRVPWTRVRNLLSVERSEFAREIRIAVARSVLRKKPVQHLRL